MIKLFGLDLSRERRMFMEIAYGEQLHWREITAQVGVGNDVTGRRSR